MKKIRVGVNAMPAQRATGGRVRIMAISYKKGKALCSPTSALERNEWILSEELRIPSFLTDSDELIVERHRSSTQCPRTWIIKGFK
jgi:hypothetical protein